MVAFLTAFSLFIASFGVQVVLWRIRVPRNQTRALLLVFGIAPLVLATFWLAGAAEFSWPVPSPADWIGIGLFHAAATGCYLIVYTGVEEDSPSITIINALEAAGNAGCSRAELASRITEDRFVRPRLLALKRGRFLEEAGDGRRLTARGRRAARTAVMLSRLFNIHESV